MWNAFFFFFASTYFECTSFTTAKVVSKTAVIFILCNSYFRSSNMYSFFHLYLHGFIKNRPKDQLPVGSLAQLVRALHRYCRGHRVRIPYKPDFFQAFFSQLQKLCQKLRGFSFYLIVYVLSLQNVSFVVHTKELVPATCPTVCAELKGATSRYLESFVPS